MIVRRKNFFAPQGAIGYKLGGGEACVRDPNERGFEPRMPAVRLGRAVARFVLPTLPQAHPRTT